MEKLGRTLAAKVEHMTKPLVGVIAIGLVFALLASGPMPKKATATKQEDASQAVHFVFSNTAAITCADRVSNNAGTNPGLPPLSLYPSTINVVGLGASITKVTVTFSITSTFPDDLDVLLVGPTGAKSLITSDAFGSGDPSNVSYTFDQTVATVIPDEPMTIVPTGIYRPSNYAGFVTPEPGGQDNFPSAGGLASYTADLNVFNGTNPNGIWSLYVVDDQVVDMNSLPGGWSLEINAGGPPTTPQHVLDFDGDGITDPTVVRNTGGGSLGQLTWFARDSTGAPATIRDWGRNGDEFVPEDYDGDAKTDIAVWRGGAPFNSYFYILQSQTGTLRVDTFGEIGDDPSVVGDYDGDGKADPAVYRGGAAIGDHSFWYYRSSVSGLIIGTEWGQTPDFPAPGDYDNDGKNDFVVQRNGGDGQARFYIRLAAGAQSSLIYGTPTDDVVPGDYDGDGKTDIATVRNLGGSIIWNILKSSDGTSSTTVFGLSATDYPTQGDWDGDGKTDLAVWRPNPDPTLNFFFWRNSSNGVDVSVEWGSGSDYPVANFNTH